MGARATNDYRKVQTLTITYRVPVQGSEPQELKKRRSCIANPVKSHVPDDSKRVTSTASNFFQFMDAIALFRSLAILCEKGIGVLTIHDAYLVHPNSISEVTSAYNEGLLVAKSMVNPNLEIDTPLSSSMEKALLESKHSLQFLNCRSFSCLKNI